MRSKSDNMNDVVDRTMSLFKKTELIVVILEFTATKALEIW